MIIRAKRASLSSIGAIKSVSGIVKINNLDNSVVAYLPDWTIKESWRDEPTEECQIIHYKLLNNIVVIFDKENKTLFTPSLKQIIKDVQNV